VEDVVGIVRLNYARRVNFYNGGAELAPGITLHPDQSLLVEVTQVVNIHMATVLPVLLVPILALVELVFAMIVAIG
jgi:hypothetical protein